MHSGVATKVMASSCGLSGFAIGVVAGLSAGNPADVILTRAMISLLACYFVGWMVGAVIERLYRDGVRAYAEKVKAASAPAEQSTDDQQVLTV